MKLYRTKNMNLQLFAEENKKEPVINIIDDNYFEVIGHYSDKNLCAKMTLLADLYAVEQSDGYAKFKIEDREKINLINNKLIFVSTYSLYIDDLFVTEWTGKMSYFYITQGGLLKHTEGGIEEYVWNSEENLEFLGFSTIKGATIPDPEYTIDRVEDISFFPSEPAYLYPVYRTYSSTINLTNSSCNKTNETELLRGYSATITADEGCYLSSVTSSLGGVVIAENKKTATITLDTITDDFTITAVGTPKTVHNIILHPNVNGKTDYTVDILPKAMPDNSKIGDYEVIKKLETLPTATETSSDFVQINRVTYQKIKKDLTPNPVIDLTNTTWYFNSNINFDLMDKYSQYNISFQFDNVQYDEIHISRSERYIMAGNLALTMYDGMAPSDEIWRDEKYRTLSITGGSDSTDTTLIQWLQQNAIIQPIIEYEYIVIGSQTSQIPSCPTSTDGSYILSCTVTSGVPNYEWISATDLGASITILSPIQE